MCEEETIENVDCAFTGEKTPSFHVFAFNELDHVILGWQLEKRLEVSEF